MDQADSAETARLLEQARAGHADAIAASSTDTGRT
jgi:hypothetical protein